MTLVYQCCSNSISTRIKLHQIAFINSNQIWGLWYFSCMLPSYCHARCSLKVGTLFRSLLIDLNIIASINSNICCWIKLNYLIVPFSNIILIFFFIEVAVDIWLPWRDVIIYVKLTFLRLLKSTHVGFLSRRFVLWREIVHLLNFSSWVIVIEQHVLTLSQNFITLWNNRLIELYL